MFRDPSGLFNPAKGLSSILNAANAARLYVGGVEKLAAGAGLDMTGVGVPAGYGVGAWGMWNLKSAGAAQYRGLLQWQEAWNENWGDATWGNLLGVLPFGSEYDDPCEPTVGQVLKNKFKKIHDAPLDFLSEFGTLLGL